MFILDTLGKVQQTRHGIHVYCRCGHNAPLDVGALVARLGPDHSCLAAAVLPHVYCIVCRAAGRDDRQISMTISPWHATG